MIHIRIQTEDFDSIVEHNKLTAINHDIGAVVEFTGLVRADEQLSGIFLEHYPGMAEKAILHIIEKARQKWSIYAVTVIHRVGFLPVAANIVYVGVASKHRKDALQCIEFIMDFLKNDVPIWKKAINGQDDFWVQQKAGDVTAKQAWEVKE